MLCGVDFDIMLHACSVVLVGAGFCVYVKGTILLVSKYVYVHKLLIS